MIAQKNRFHGHGSLNFLFTHGKTVRCPLFGIKYTTNPKRDDYRLAVIASKKVAPLAVTRNRIRRRLFEQMRTQLPQRFSSVDMAIIVYDAEVSNVEAAKLEQMISNLIKQIVRKTNQSSQ